MKQHDEAVEKRNREGEEGLGMGDWSVKEDGLAEGGGAEGGDGRVGPVREIDLEWGRGEGICVIKRERVRTSPPRS